ncbi:hypothetical protein [Burkholderia sp. BCC1998]|uniref:hypothetical protein n=1 Tax=Burkholderia sp. BCC1998 TaxID=2817447 RepID=UPI002AB66E7E|nr:hypothetical protein [Burkholderia sp. BCC1998]
MVKTLAACAAFCIAAVAFPRFHEAAADRNASAHAFAADARRIGVRNTAADEARVAPSSTDGNAGRQAAAARGADQPPAVALGVANAGWSNLFNH